MTVDLQVYITCHLNTVSKWFTITKQYCLSAEKGSCSSETRNITVVWQRISRTSQTWWYQTTGSGGCNVDNSTPPMFLHFLHEHIKGHSVPYKGENSYSITFYVSSNDYWLTDGDTEADDLLLVMWESQVRDFVDYFRQVLFVARISAQSNEQCTLPGLLTRIVSIMTKAGKHLHVWQ